MLCAAGLAERAHERAARSAGSRAGPDRADISPRGARQQRNGLPASQPGEVDSAAVKVDGIDVRCMLRGCCRVCAIVFKVRSSPA
jgi:hypothetical protein